MPVLRNLRSVVNRFGIPGGIEVRRRVTDPAVDVNGNQTRGVEAVIKVKPATVHPARGSDLEALPEGDRNFESIMIFTRDELRTATSGDGEADRVCYDGKDYKVVSAEQWDRQSGHWRSIAQRREA